MDSNSSQEPLEEKRLFLRNAAYHSCVPLRALKVDALVTNSIASITMHQLYENTLPSPIETEFYFPIDPNFALSSIVIQFNDGREVHARIYELESP